MCVKKTCPECEKEFLPYMKRTKYCSDECRMERNLRVQKEYREAHPLNRPCRRCKIIIKHPTHRYYCLECAELLGTIKKEDKLKKQKAIYRLRDKQRKRKMRAGKTYKQREYKVEATRCEEEGCNTLIFKDNPRKKFCEPCVKKRRNAKARANSRKTQEESLRINQNRKTEEEITGAKKPINPMFLTRGKIKGQW